MRRTGEGFSSRLKEAAATALNRVLAGFAKGRFCLLRDCGSASGSAQGLAHGGREFVHCKGFFYHDFVGKLSLEPRLVDIAGDENRPDWALGASLFEQLDSDIPGIAKSTINRSVPDRRRARRAALPLETSMTLYPLSRNKSAVISRRRYRRPIKISAHRRVHGRTDSHANYVTVGALRLSLTIRKRMVKPPLLPSLLKGTVRRHRAGARFQVNLLHGVVDRWANRIELSPPA
jgi:hypothetical protein